MRIGSTIRQYEAGFTLVEIVVAIVIISMAAATLVGLMSAVAERSANAMQQSQAANIADSYLQRVLSKPFPPAADNIDNYNGLNDAGARDQFGTAIGTLANYQISVNVASIALGAVPSGQSRRVTVTVTSPAGGILVLSGFRTNHP